MARDRQYPWIVRQRSACVLRPELVGVGDKLTLNDQVPDQQKVASLLGGSSIA
jgi:hypothetical protein